MGFIEEMAKAKAFDDIQTKQVADAMTAASKALEEQRVGKLLQGLNGAGLAGSMSAISKRPVQPVVPNNPVQQAAPVVANQGLASTLVR